MKEQVYILDRNGYQVPNTAGALAHIRNLSWRTQIPGGYADCDFEMPLHFLRGWDVRPGYTLAVYDGLQCLWYGRIEDHIRYAQIQEPLHNGWRKIRAFGYGQTLKQRLYSRTFSSGTVYASDVIRDMLAQSLPLVAADLTDIGNPGVNLQPISWTNTKCDVVMEQLLKYGDSSTPPGEWTWAVWGPEPRWAATMNSDWHEGVASNSPLDPAWTGKIAGSGTITMSGANLRINTGSTAANAAIIVTANALPSDKVYRVETKTWHDFGLQYGLALGIANSSTQPTTGGGLNWPTIFVRPHSAGEVKIAYANNAGSYQWWNGSAWVGSESTAYNLGGEKVWFIAVFASTGTGWFVQIQNSSGTVLTTTSAVNWSDTQNSSLSQWLVLGEYGTSFAYLIEDIAYVRMYRPTTLPIMQFWLKDLSDYDLQIPLSLIRGNMELADTLADTVNNVIASYGSGPSYTTAASDATSIAAYDQRDDLVAAGNVAVGVANTARDTRLQAGKDVGRQLSPFTVRGAVRNKAGARYPLNRVRAGMRFIVPEIGDDVYMIGSTDYKADTGEMSISITGAPRTVDMLLAAAAKAAGV